MQPGDTVQLGTDRTITPRWRGSTWIVRSWHTVESIGTFYWLEHPSEDGTFLTVPSAWLAETPS